MVKYQVQKRLTSNVVDPITGLVTRNESWEMYCDATSVKQAMREAKPLIIKEGVDNVQICKVIPSSVAIVFEED